MASIPQVARDNQSLARQLAQYKTLKELYSSHFYAEHSTEIESVLNTPDIATNPEAKPCIRDFLRVALWNIERGNNFEGVVHYLQTLPMLATADILFLNELDVGMIRTGNRHIANDLGEALGFHVAYAPEYLEMTKGVEDELNLKGENTTALHGNAILSRYPISNVRIISLPTCFEPFEFHEKRYGRRIAIVVDVDFNGRNVTAITTHLEVRNTPACRACQTERIVRQLDQQGIRGPIIIGGDFNSNSFARGTKSRTLRGAWWLLTSKPSKVKHRLLYPEQGSEPLFDILRQHNFLIREFNSQDHTARIPLKMIEEVGKMPEKGQDWVHKRLAAYNHELLMRLDWICGRSVRPLGDGEVVDQRSGIPSAAPQTFHGLYYKDRRASDHAPITADIAIVD